MVLLRPNFFLLRFSERMSGLERYPTDFFHMPKKKTEKKKAKMTEI